MFNFITIKLKALFMLVVFTSNLFAACHCSAAATVTSVAKHGCCEAKHADKGECPNAKPLSDHKDGCCESGSIKFNLLDKQASEKINISPTFSIAFLDYYFNSGITDKEIINSEKSFHKDPLLYHSSPDLQALYQTFLI